MELKFNEAKTVRPNHLERCLCYDKFLKGYRCYVYDDISKYWCTQATTEHDPDGENHIVDYSDFQVTEWASLSNVNKPSLPSNLDEMADSFAQRHFRREYFQVPRDGMRAAFKAGAEWAARQGIKLHGRILPGTRCNLYIESDCFDRGYKGLNYSFSDSNDVDMFVQIRKK